LLLSKRKIGKWEHWEGGALVGEEHWKGGTSIGKGGALGRGSIGKESSLPNAPVLSLSNVPFGEGSIGKGLEYQLLFCFYLSFHPMIFGIVSVNSVCLYFLHHIHSLYLF